MNINSMTDMNNFEINVIDPKQFSEYENKIYQIELLICSKCHFIFNEPNDCSICKITICSNCIESEIDISTNVKILKCPTLCKNPEFKVSTMVNNLLKPLEFKCLRGCGNIIKYREYIKHVNSCLGQYDKCPACQSLVLKEKILSNIKQSDENLVLLNELNERDDNKNMKIDELTALNIFLNDEIKYQENDLNKQIKLNEEMTNKNNKQKDQIKELTNKLKEQKQKSNLSNQNNNINNNENIDSNQNNSNNNISSSEAICDSKNIIFSIVTNVNQYIIKLLEEINTSDTLKYLKLSFKGLTNKNLIKIFNEIKGNKTITCLDLSDNSIIKKEVADKITNLIIHNSNITQLTLKNCSIDSLIMKQIIESLKVKTSIIYLDLSNNNIDNEGVKYIREEISKHKYVKVVELK